jgi:hypothetical protein
MRESRKKWLTANREKRNEWQRAYCKSHPEKMREYKKRYNEKNKEKVNKRNRDWDNSLKGKYATCRRQAKKRGIIFDLPYEYFCYLERFTCNYCGDSVDGVRLDRVDSSFGYEIGNVVQCCSTCNYMKNDMNYRDFVDKCNKIAFLCNSNAFAVAS